ncbi:MULTISPECIES: hypothetical protein [Photorhabdus]|uniref:Uncharacterized protein n=1 Tax=Photorhabdus bodei TaxID=2029681 RepID=A0AAW6BD28_9GAMM|nr:MULTISPECIES: hypothetical protein [Photorhabdus]MCT8350937.1 hypothetical protein [Photorhabdus kayaii]MDB6367419.1 hypothetical protein [Photorhabdus bodei]MDB6371113.1 hypothetical protein [Photorhabdus bodei]
MVINQTSVLPAKSHLYTLWISRCIATARERIPGSIDNYVTGVSECSQQRGNLKDNGYIRICWLLCKIVASCMPANNIRNKQ